MSHDEIEVQVSDQVAKIGELLKSQPTGSYFIEDISLMDGATPKMRLLTLLIMKLQRAFPGFYWQQTENYGQRGILITWHRK